MNQPAKTTAPDLISLPYQRDSAVYFHIISRHLPMAVILQSDVQTQSSQEATRGRFDILTAAPEYCLSSRNGFCTLSGKPPAVLSVCRSSFASLHGLIQQMENQPVDYAGCLAEQIPFCGGLIGYCSYDLAREYLPLSSTSHADIDIPDMQFGFYGWACIQDHQRQKSWLVIHPDCSNTLQQTLRDLLPTAIHSASRKSSAEKIVAATPFTSNLDVAAYREAFSRIQHYIHAGDCYQINLSQRFQASAHAIDPRELYLQLRRTMPSPFCAYLPIAGSDNAILCLSPERFLQLTPDKNVVTQPIKGTTTRASDPVIDHDNATRLQNDPKNRAENLMIVDLLRNDLGQVCETGSVRADKLFELQSFANVHHLVSTITGKLRQNLNGADLLQACFPGGSITGAPKIRAMQIIEELEPARRSIYCGSIAYFSAHGAMDSNIAIRTVLWHDNNLYCWGGGGIVADSDADSEYRESITKVGSLLAALGG